MINKTKYKLVSMFLDEIITGHGIETDICDDTLPTNQFFDSKTLIIYRIFAIAMPKCQIFFPTLVNVLRPAE